MDANVLNRRQFLLKTAQISAGVSVLPIAQNSFSEALEANALAAQPFSMVQGVTTESQTQITIDVPEDMQISYRLFDPLTLISHEPSQVRITPLSVVPWSVHYVQFTGLMPEQNYLLQLFDKDMKMIDERELKTLDLSKRQPKIGFVSCARDSIENFKIWSKVVAAQPDLLIFMGDNVYGDMHVDPGPTNLIRRYIEARSRIFFYRSKKLIPVVAIWDDHDFGQNNADGDYQHKESSLKTFKTFYPRDTIEGIYAHGPGVAGSLRAFGLQFLMLDGRYFRSNKKAANRMLFGAEQTNWAFSQIESFDGPTWLIMGNQFFGAFNHRESFEGVFQRDFSNFIERLRATKKLAFFAGGDVHHSETMNIEPEILDYPTFELTASSIHSISSPFIRRNDRRRKSTTSKNFVLVTTNFVDDKIQVGFRAIDKDAKVKFSDNIELDLSF